MAQSCSGQDKITLQNFLPAMFFLKQDLINSYSEKRYSYGYFVSIDEVDESGRAPAFNVVKTSTSISYQSLDHYDTVTYTVNFNEQQQIIGFKSNQISEWEDCFSTREYDTPYPIVSEVSMTYNSQNDIIRIDGRCKSGAYRTKTDYYYNSSNELDSIVSKRGSGDLIPYQKIIFLDSALFDSEPGNSTVLILNQRFDYKTWILREYGELPYFDENGSRMKKRTDFANNRMGNDYYEFDSLGRTIRVGGLNVNGGFTNYKMVSPPSRCDPESSPMMFLFWYNEQGQIGWADNVGCRNGFGQYLAWYNAGRLKIDWKNNEIKKLYFHNNAREIATWTPKKEWKLTEIAPSFRPKAMFKHEEKMQLNYSEVEESLKGFIGESELINNYYSASWHMDSSSNIFVTYPRPAILSDTVNGIIRFIYLGYDSETDIYYAKDGELLKVHLLKLNQEFFIYPTNNREFMVMEGMLDAQKYDGLYDRTIYAKGKKRFVDPYDWEEIYDANRISRNRVLHPAIESLKVDMAKAAQSRYENLIEEVEKRRQ